MRMRPESPGTKSEYERNLDLTLAAHEVVKIARRMQDCDCFRCIDLRAAVAQYDAARKAAGFSE